MRAPYLAGKTITRRGGWAKEILQAIRHYSHSVRRIDVRSINGKHLSTSFGFPLRLRLTAGCGASTHGVGIEAKLCVCDDDDKSAAKVNSFVASKLFFCSKW